MVPFGRQRSVPRLVTLPLVVPSTPMSPTSYVEGQEKKVKQAVISFEPMKCQSLYLRGSRCLVNYLLIPLHPLMRLQNTEEDG